ncbi:MAG: hypothetical protein NC343_05635 [Muribaculum sp.]|nr:hypothetical protein [Muribaculaceae bacterium]MCM1081213.1 hypothetical protein [Muribaculum sp.]
MKEESKTTSRSLWQWAIDGGLFLIAIGILLPLLKIDITTFRWVYTAGAVLTLVGRILTPYRGSYLRVKRLHRIQTWSGIFFCVGAFFMFYPSAGASDWLAFTLAGAAIVIYTSIMIPLTQRKENS